MTGGVQEVFRLEDVVFDAASGDVTYPDGTTLRLRPQAAKVLALLAQQPGVVVPRSEIRETVWADTIVEFDQGVNACIREIRKALNDSASSPRFLETLPRRGYRLIASVEREPAPDEGASGNGVSQHTVGSGLRAARPHGARMLFVVAIALGMVGTSSWLASFTERGDEAPRVIVLPFTNSAISSLGDTLADVLFDRLIDELSQVAPEQLGVIAQVSARRYAQSGEPLTTPVLDIDAAVEGSVTRDPGFTLSLRVIDPETETQSWAVRIPIDPGDLRGALDAAVDGVVSAVDPSIERVGDPTRAVDAQHDDEVLRIGYLLGQYEPSATERASDRARAALDQYPESPALRSAWAEILRRRGDLDAAVDEASDVLRTTPSWQASTVLATVSMARADWVRAREHIERAIAIAPGMPRPLHLASFVYSYLGQTRLALESIEAATRIDPIAADLIADAGIVYLWAGAHERAQERCSNAVLLDPENEGALRCLVDLAWITQSPEVGEDAAQVLLGRRGAAPDDGAWMTEYFKVISLQEPDQQRCGTIWRSKALVALGRAVEARDAAEPALDGDPFCLRIVAVDPFFAEMRADPDVRRALEAEGFLVEPDASEP